MSGPLNIHKSYVDELIAFFSDIKIVQASSDLRVFWTAAMPSAASETVLSALPQPAAFRPSAGEPNSEPSATAAAIFVGSSSRVRNVKQLNERRDRLLAEFVNEQGAVAYDPDLRATLRKLEVSGMFVVGRRTVTNA